MSGTDIFDTTPIPTAEPPTNGSSPAPPPASTAAPAARKRNGAPQTHVRTKVKSLAWRKDMASGVLIAEGAKIGLEEYHLSKITETNRIDLALFGLQVRLNRSPDRKSEYLRLQEDTPVVSQRGNRNIRQEAVALSLADYNAHNRGISLDQEDVEYKSILAAAREKVAEMAKGDPGWLSRTIGDDLGAQGHYRRLTGRSPHSPLLSALLD